MHVFSRCVAWFAGVDDSYLPTRATEHKRSTQSGGAASNHNHVIRFVVHARACSTNVGLATFVAVSGGPGLA